MDNAISVRTAVARYARAIRRCSDRDLPVRHRNKIVRRMCHDYLRKLAS